MKNLFKSVLRSFSKTKISLISLTFLIFVSVGVFSLLNNTSYNFKNSYETLVQKGNLNQFVVNEKYDYGNYQFEIASSSPDASDPSQETYNIELNPDSLNNFVRYIVGPSGDKYVKDASTFQVTASSGLTINDLSSNPDYQDNVNKFSESLHNSPKVKSILNQDKTNYRNYLALDVTDGSIQKKLVQSDPTDQINKLVLYQGNGLENSYSSEFSNFYNLYYEAKNELKTNTDPVSQKVYLTQDKFNPLYQALYNNIDPNIDPSSTEGYKKDFKDVLANVFNKTIKDSDITELVNFFNGDATLPSTNNNINFSWGLSGTKQVSLIDPTSYIAVAAPGNWKYESAKGKKVFNNLDYWKQISDPKNAYSFQTNFNKIDDKYKIKIDKTTYLIMGVGITPDFMYPIFNTTSLVPNPESQYLYYINDSGYKRIRQAFQNNPQESYIVGTFPKGSSLEDQEQIINDINSWSSKNMSWPSDIRSAYFANDTSNLLNLSAARIIFIPTLIRTISIASLLLTLIIVGLAMFVGILVVKNYITKNRPTLAVLQANGINKLKINFSVLLFSIIPSLIGGIIGYVTGFALQSSAAGIFSNYWFMPVYLSSFSVLTLFLSIILPLIVFCAASLIVGYFVLRQNIVKSLKNDSDYKVSKFSLAMKRPLAKFGVITRFRASLAFNSFWKLIILCSLSAATMVVFDFALASQNIFQIAQNDTKKTHDYNYAVDLVTPTQQSGLIKYQPIEDLGKTDPFDPTIDAKDSVKNGGMFPSYFLNNGSENLTNWGSQSNSGSFKTNYDNIQVLSINDQIAQSNYLTYLNNFVESKISLDYNIGLPGVLEVNPWQLSSSLMPSNQALASDQAYQTFLRTILKFNDDPKNYSSELEQSSDKAENDTYITRNPDGLLSINSKNAVGIGALKPDFLKYLAKQFDRIADKKYPPVDYKITYNLIGLDDNTIMGSENPTQASTKYANGYGSPKYSYTWIDGRDTKKDSSLKVMGIKNYINYNLPIPSDYLGPILTDKNGKVINQELFNTDVSNPIIVNKFTAQKYNLKVGDTLDIKIMNRYDRVTNEIKKQNGDSNVVLDPVVTFQVIGINDSAKDNEIYTSYKVANTLLGFTQDEIDKGLPFNGYFSNTLDTFNGTTPLFSESGLYPGSADFSPQNSGMLNLIKNAIDGYKNNPTSQLWIPGYKALLLALGYTSLSTAPELDSSNAANYLTQLNNIYSAPYGTMISYIYNVDANDGLFDTISQTSIAIQNVVIGLIIPIVILIVILISNMLIDELRKIGIRLKALGYSNWKILLSFLSIYIPVFIIGLIISIPISIGLIKSYNQIIFNASNIVLGTSLDPLTCFISLIFLTLVFTVTFISNWISLRWLKIAQEIKNY